MNDLQKCQLDILKNTIEILDKNNLRYFLAFGSLIGAVRHNGFIPWDDDVDIVMPRPDYDKFSKIANEILPDDLFYQDYITDAEYPYGFAKIRKNNTLFVQKPVEKFNIHHGVYLDIFPLDGSDNNGIYDKKHVRKCMILHYMCMVDTFKNSETTKSFKKKLEIFGLKTLRLIIGKKKVRELFEKNVRKYTYENSQNVGCVFGTCVNNANIKKSYYENDEKKYSIVSFEGLDIKAPAECDEYLRTIYGDYMKLPPEDKRASHHQLVELKL